MRLILLFLRTRRTGYAVLGLSIVALIGAMAADWLLHVPQLGGTSGHALIPVILLMPLLSACLIGAGIDSPSGELERTVSYRVSKLRALHLLLLGAFASTSLIVIAQNWNQPDAEWMLLRNLAGFLGLTLLSAWMIGGKLSWIVPLAFAMFSLLTGRNSAGEIASWAWTVLPGDDTIALLTAVMLLLSGAALLIRHGSRSMAARTNLMP